MALPNDVHLLDGDIQLDDVYLGGERAGRKRGRGSENKVPFVAAVSADDEGYPIYTKLMPVAGFSKEAISVWAKQHLAPTATVNSEGLACFAAVIDADRAHVPTVVGKRKPRDLPEFRWINAVLANLKTTLAGAYHSFKYRKCAGAYLAVFAYRFNRRFDLVGLAVRLIVDVARCAPRPQRVILKA